MSLAVSWLVILFVVASCLAHAQIISSFTIYVTSADDTTPNGSLCYPTSQPGACTLRSAWAACLTYSSATNQCVIEMLTNSVIYLNVATYGSLVLSNTANIKMSGNEAVVLPSTVSATVGSSFSSFPLEHSKEYFKNKLRSKDVSDHHVFGSQINELPLGSIEEIIEESMIDEPLPDSVDVEEDQEVRRTTTTLESIHTTATATQFITYSGTSIKIYPTLQLSNFSIAKFGSSSVPGGVMSTSGNITLLVDNMAFYYNAGSNGGILYINKNSYSLSITDSEFYYNTATYGGCLYIDQNNHNIQLADNLFIANTGITSGGVLYAYKYNPKINTDGNYFLNNTAPSGGSMYIYEFNDRFYLTNSMFYNGIASSRGGFVVLYAYNNYMYMDGNLFHKASTSSRGGCLYFGFSNYFTTISNNVLEYCVSQFYSGAIHMENDITNFYMMDNTFNYNYAKGNGGVMRIGVYCKNVQLLRNKYYNSYCQQGGSIYSYQDNQHFLIADSIFDGNAQSQYTGLINGAAVRLYQRNYNVTIIRCVMKNLLGNYGGAIASYSMNHNLIVQDSLIQDTTSSAGGGLYLEKGNYHTLVSNVTIQRCTSTGMGAGIYLQTNNYDVRIVNTKIFGNVADQHGGAIAMSNNNTQVMIAGCNISSNQAINNGGGIYMQSTNNFFFMMDLQAYQNFAIVQSQHPYQSGSPGSDGSPYIIMSQYISVPEAKQFVLAFDPLTYIYFVDVLYIYTDTTMKTVVYETDVATTYPGVTSPPLIVDSSSLYFVFSNSKPQYTPTTYADNNYGFKIYVTPIIAKPQQPTTVVSNTAILGGALYQFSQNLNSIIVSSLLANNHGFSGGGLYLRDANTLFSMYQSQFVKNQAEENGGAVVFLSSHYGSVFHNISFEENSCGVYGGSIYSNVQNGVGTLGIGNAITTEQCYFRGNVAGSSGGAIYLEDGNLFLVSQSSFEQNKATTVSGGGIFAAQGNQLTITQSTLESNTASTCGGAIASLQSNAVTVSNTTIQANMATNGGGGVCILTKSRFSFSGTIKIIENIAAIGGGIYLSSAPMWLYTKRQQFLVSGNEANFGSAFFIKALVPSTSSMEYLTIRSNIARTGGTLYWLADQDMSEAPAGYNSSTNIWSNNQAEYGKQVGTQAVKIVGPDIYNVVVYGQAIAPPLIYSLQDHYASFIPLNGTTTFYPTINSSADEHCLGFFAYLSGSNILGTGIKVESGLGKFNDLQVNCAPNGSLYLSVQALLGEDVGIPSSKASAYYLTMDTQLRFRNCSIGEYAKNGQCFECPAGSYSLEPNAVTCAECNSVSGIDACIGAEIVVSNGYWRRYPDTSAVLTCLFPDNCVGGNATGDALCAEGSSGPLCSVCIDGYYLDGTLCVACSGGSVFNPTLIAFIVIFGLLVVTSVLIYFFYNSIFYTDDPANLATRSTSKRPQSVTANANIEMQQYHADFGDDQSSAFSMSSMSTTSGATIVEVSSVVDEERELSDWELTWLWLKCKYGQIMVKVKIIVSTFQVVMSSTEVLSVSFPPIFTDWMNSFSFLNFSISKIFPLGCSETYSFIETLVLTTLIPIGLAFVIFIAFAGEYQFRSYLITQRNKKNTGEQRVGERLEIYETLRDKYLNYFFYLTYLVLPSVTTTIFQMYLCTNVDPDGENPQDTNYYLTADMNISCDSQIYYDGVLYASCMIIVYPIGIPAMYLYLLYLTRHELLHRNDVEGTKANKDDADKKVEAISALHTNTWVDNPLAPKPSDNTMAAGSNTTSTAANPVEPVAEDQQVKELSSSASRLAFLWEAYLPEYWYWEVIETTRRLVLTAVLSVCSSGTSEQSVLSILLALVYIKIYSLYNPYADASSNILAETGQYQIFFTFFCSMVITNALVSSSLTGLIGAMLVLVNLSVVGMSFYFDLLEYYEEEVSGKEEGKDIKGEYTVRAFVLRMKSTVYGEHHPQRVQPSRSAVKATSKATAMYLKARQRNLQHSGPSNNSNFTKNDNLQNSPAKPKFTYVEESSSIKQIVNSIRSNQDSDDEVDE